MKVLVFLLLPRYELAGIQHDKNLDSWTLYTNHIGPKWFFYYFDKEAKCFVFGTELKMVVAGMRASGIEPELCEEGVYLLLTINSTPIKDITSQGIKKCKNLKFGKNKNGFFWGKKVHLIITQEGIPVKFRLTQANEDDAGVGKEMLNNLNGLIIADRGYFKGSFLFQFTKEGDLRAVVRPKSSKKDSRIVADLFIGYGAYGMV